MATWENIVSEDKLTTAFKERNSTETKKTKVEESEVAALVADGWIDLKDKITKKKLHTLVKTKSVHDQFENRVWTIFYKMGFTHMNAANKFKIEMPGNSKQIDVFAMDSETCILIECKAAKTIDRNCNFKKELESIHGYYNDVCKAIEKKYGPRKFKYIFATENYVIDDNSADMNRMKSFGIYYMDQDTVDYYSELVDHLGTSARYQFLGNIFSKEEIDGLACDVPALCGKMGEVTYYSFLIEPSKLLKLSYVLHRNKANHLMMPTYQRLIKKNRLSQIREFVNDKGYFPNSIIVSTDENDDDMVFESAADSLGYSANYGILHLPKRYQSLYVIDGQHRLYGYSETKYCDSNVIPVVAFAKLARNKQVKMFMDINEQQKRVSKSLRNTLMIDLLSDSPNPRERKDALMLRMAEELGESQKSPLYSRVVCGEDKPNARRCITTEVLKDAFKRSDFLNDYTKNGTITKNGTFDKGDIDTTRTLLMTFLIKSLSLIEEGCKEEWEKGAGGYLTINNMSYAIIKTINDIVNIQLKKKGLTTVNDIDALYVDCETMLYELQEVIENLPFESQQKIKKAKGDGAKKESWRVLQVAMNSMDSEFINDDLQKYLDENCTDLNPEALSRLLAIEIELKNRFKKALTQDPNWLTQKIPDNLASELVARVAKENLKRDKRGQSRVNNEDMISFEDMCKISTHSSNWNDFVKNILQRKKATLRTDALNWLRNLPSWQSKLQKNQKLQQQEYVELEEIFNDFCSINE